MTANVVALCPLEVERAHLARRVPGLSSIVRTGPGGDAIRRAIAELTGSGSHPDLVILVGVAGGLRPTPPALGAASIADGAGRRWTPPVTLGEARGAILGVDRTLGFPEQKREAAASSGADLVDCESHAFAEACEQRGLHWAVVRGVSDGPDDTVPPEAGGWIAPDGRTRVGAVLADAVRRPALIGRLVELARGSARAMDEAGRIVASAARAPDDGAVAPRWARTVLVFGGSFDPVTSAHIKLGIAARDAVGADWITFVPARRSPHKSSGPVASDADRLAMVDAALDGVPRASASDLEIDGPPDDRPSYTVETLERAVGASAPGVRVRLVIGADQAEQFHRWRAPHRILELAEPVVLARGDRPIDQTLESMRPHWRPEELEAWRDRFVEAPRSEVSSTRVRELLRSGDTDSDELRAALPAPVLGVIRDRGLYRPA